MSGNHPSSFNVAGGGLHPPRASNSLGKYADDTYLMVPASARYTQSPWNWKKSPIGQIPTTCASMLTSLKNSSSLRDQEVSTPSTYSWSGTSLVHEDTWSHSPTILAL